VSLGQKSTVVGSRLFKRMAVRVTPLTAWFVQNGVFGRINLKTIFRFFMASFSVSFSRVNEWFGGKGHLHGTIAISMYFFSVFKFR